MFWDAFVVARHQVNEKHKASERQIMRNALKNVLRVSKKRQILFHLVLAKIQHYLEF